MWFLMGPKYEIPKYEINPSKLSHISGPSEALD